MSPRAGAARLEHSARIFDALGDRTRLRLVTRIAAGGPQSIAALTQGSTMTRQAITKHLRVLAGAGLVRGRRSGRERRWELNAGRLDAAERYLELISRRWDERLERLRVLVER
jgi:DNA-binding transcriptional ArsR family regulator